MPYKIMMAKNIKKTSSGEAFCETFLEICRRKDYKSAIDLQKEMTVLIPGKPLRNRIKTICGLDISFSKKSNRIYAAAAAYSYPALSLIEELSIEDFIDFPYIPGLLAFREGPIILKLISELQEPFDLLLFDGHGIAHPRGAGIASMVGLFLNKPSIGCAKTKLVGEYREPSNRTGSWSDLILRGIVIGRVLRTRDNVKPVFVSVGYKIDLEAAANIVLNCCRRFRIPEPLRTAHRLSNNLRLNKSGPAPFCRPRF